ncbi:MAG: DNA-directed RNA polymerase subunit omega [Lachnospiraceae bacterium]|nr:DNA-directed RNA polymerase subunit omega [Lachnospiraceae bacterium]
MLHPSYADLIEVLNSEVEEGEQPVVNSRYSVVLATAKRARQLINGAEPMADHIPCSKPLSIAVEEVYEGKVKIIGDEEKNVQ